MSVDDKKKHLLTLFPQDLDWESKYKIIISMGKQLPEMPMDMKTEKNLIKGCQSQVWLFAELDPSTKAIKFYGDSDALIVKGLVAILLSVFNQESPAEIMGSSLDFIEKVGLKEHLTPSRANGLMAMVQQIKNYSVAFNYLLNKQN